MIDAVLPTYNRAPLAFERGEGAWAITSDGTRYLDLAAGIAVNVLGHANPELIAALTEQAGRIWHVSNLYHIPQQEELARRLVEATFADTVFVTNSGTEAAELAIKMVRKYWFTQGQPDRIEIVTFAGAFHGRSTGAIAAAGSEKMVKGYGPLMPGFVQVPWDDVEALRAAVSDRTAAIMVEPVQGEGGIRPLSDETMRAIAELREATGCLVVFDEVQCGVGRTGRLFAHEWAGVAPDIMMVAKGIGGGFPLGAVLANEKAAAPMTVGSHGSTYGGNPLACAVGCKVLEIVTAPDFLPEVNRKAALMRQKLEGLAAAHPDLIEGVTGVGLMLGLKLKRAPAALVEAGYAEHLLTVPAANDTIRLLPPLNITDAEISEAVARLDRAATRVTAADAPATPAAAG